MHGATSVRGILAAASDRVPLIAAVLLTIAVACGGTASMPATPPSVPTIDRVSAPLATPLVGSGPLTLHIPDIDPTAYRGSIVSLLAETRPHTHCVAALRMGDSVVTPSNVFGDSNSGDDGTCSFAWYVPGDAELGLYNLSIVAYNQSDVQEGKVFVEVIP